MPRLTVDPQVKPSKAPTAAGCDQSLPDNAGASLCAEPQHPDIRDAPLLWVLHKQESCCCPPYKGDTGSREQPGGSISWLVGEVQDHAGRQQVLPTVGHPLLSSFPGHWLRFEEPRPGCQMTTGDAMPSLSFPIVPTRALLCLSRGTQATSHLLICLPGFSVVLSCAQPPPRRRCFLGFGVAVKSLGLLSHFGAGTKSWCGTLWGV